MNRNQKIQDELSEISNFVANIPFINVYNCPPDYFKNFSLSLTPKLSLENNPDSLLNDINEKDIYKIPERYFDTFSDRMLELIDNEKKKSAYEVKCFQIIRLSLAACVISLLGYFIYQFIPISQNLELDNNTALLIKEANQIISKGNFEDEINKLDEDDLVSYLKEGGQDVDAAIVASLEDENQLKENEIYLYDNEAFKSDMNKLNIHQSKFNSN